MRKLNKPQKLLVIVAAAFLAMQLVPFGRDHVNPAPRVEPTWDSAHTRQLAARACFDCHSNETRWPWYAWVAPISWIVTNDVMGGRHELNFSEWDRRQRKADEAAEAVLEGYMPPSIYAPLHPEAELSDDERRALASSFERMFGKASKD